VDDVLIEAGNGIEPLVVVKMDDLLIRALASLLNSGQLRLLRRSRFRHRLSTSGTPTQYELIVALLR
jgi:hypothetical protein